MDYHNHVYPEHELIVTGSDPRSGQGDLRPTTGDGPSLSFDVVVETWWGSDRPAEFHICYAASGRAGSIPAGSYELIVRVDGGDQSVERSFRVEKEWHEGSYGPLLMSLKP